MSELDRTSGVAVLVILQNAWSPTYAGGKWPRASWLRALHRSRSGQRLAVMTGACPRLAFQYDNTTPEVSADPNGVCPPDLQHLRTVCEEMRPHYVVACGKQAGEAMRQLGYTQRLLQVPHPAYRLVTNQLFERAGALLVTGFEGVIELRQERNEVKEVKHNQQLFR